jgi:hypothetical protein
LQAAFADINIAKDSSVQYYLAIDMIRAGTTLEARRESGEWLFVDIGFASNSRSCGLVEGDGTPEALRFCDLASRGRTAVTSRAGPLNLLIEAPLSVAFTSGGNPTGRTVEKRSGRSRYWYVGLGCGVLVAAMYLLRSLQASGPACEVRLFEGFVSFKRKGAKSSHINDVLRLREAVWSPAQYPDALVPPERLALRDSDVLISAFKVAGMDYGVPPVVKIDG